jgi:hypothetical protein
MRLSPAIGGTPSIRCSADRRQRAGHSSGDVPQVVQGANAACLFDVLVGRSSPTSAGARFKTQETLESFVHPHRWGQVRDGQTASRRHRHPSATLHPSRTAACGASWEHAAATHTGRSKAVCEDVYGYRGKMPGMGRRDCPSACRSRTRKQNTGSEQRQGCC